MPEFLIDKLKRIGTPLDFTFVSRSSLLTMEGKKGEYQAYKYMFKINGEDVSEKIFPKTHDFVLSKAQPGQVCRAEVDPKNDAFVKWTLIPFGEAALDVPGPSTNQSNKAAKQYGEMDAAQNVKECSIILQAFCKSMIERGDTDDQVRQNAPGMARWAIRTAKEISQNPDL